MHEDSPPPFIVIRTPAVIPTKVDPYQLSLELVGIVYRIVENAGTRFYLKDKLDRAATGLVFELGRAAAAVSTIRWKNYRAAQAHASDVATVLDILVHQQAAPAEDLEQARQLVRRLLVDIS